MTRWELKGEARSAWLAGAAEVDESGAEVRERIVSTVLERDWVICGSCLANCSESERREERVPVCRRVSGGQRGPTRDARGERAARDVRRYMRALQGYRGAVRCPADMLLLLHLPLGARLQRSAPPQQLPSLVSAAV